MAFEQNINFRSTSGYVTDAAKTHVQTAITADYPATPAAGDSAAVGYTVIGPDGVDSRDRNSGNDARLAGLHFNYGSGVNSVSRYRIDLPAPGDYVISVALGDANAGQTTECEVFDDTASLGVLVSGTTSAAQRFKDATNTQLTETTWPTSAATVTKTFTTSVAIFKLGAGGATPVWAHISIKAATGGSTYGVSASDAATATDAATQQLAAPAAATDAASAADSASNLGVLTRSASDAAAATDAATVTLTIPASASDAAAATDASTSASAVNSAATDAVAASDAATQLAVLPAAASDAAAVTDAATNLGVLTRSATDAAAASDAATGLRVTLGSASDAVTATDTAAQVSAANVAATDAISAADAATVQAVLVGIVSDGFSAIDAATLLAGIYNVTAADVLSLLDVALADGGVQYARAPSGMGSPLIYAGTERPAVISGTRPGNINTARPANRGGRRS